MERDLFLDFSMSSTHACPEYSNIVGEVIMYWGMKMKQGKCQEKKKETYQQIMMNSML